MAVYRTGLPQLDGGLFLTDGGLETTLARQRGVEPSQFVAVDLLRSDAGCALLRDYFRRFATLAAELDAGFIFDSATWRASHAWGLKLGYQDGLLERLNRRAISLLEGLRGELSRRLACSRPLVISACVGPRAVGHRPADMMDEASAQRYHSAQIETFWHTSADLITALAMTYAEEAIGVVRAAKAVGMPVVVVFALRGDGRLASGQPLAQAIRDVDQATDQGPAYYMISGVYPGDCVTLLDGGDARLGRLRGIRASAWRRDRDRHGPAQASSPPGDPADAGDARLAQFTTDCRTLLAGRALNVLGGCCGAGLHHVAAIGRAGRARLADRERPGVDAGGEF